MERAERWFAEQGWEPAAFQREVWQRIADGESGLLHSSTGSGKTLAVWMAALEQEPDELAVIWITPLRSLAHDTLVSLQAPAPDWQIELRTGDVGAGAKQKQLKQVPQALIITPESLTLMLALKAAGDLFGKTRLIVVDEWHELLGSKRGTQTELALARLRQLAPQAAIWGLSATLGNVEQAAQVLMPDRMPSIVRGETRKEIVIDSLLPAEIERFPWSGHMGSRMIGPVIEALDESESSLVFCNTRSQAEIWRQSILDAEPPWADRVGLHHGSLGLDVRRETEEGLKSGSLKAVVCTSSLDLGVDFSPVERVFQVGSPKGVARLLQRAGRSGHRPGVPSRVTCVPTHAWELLDIAAARRAAGLGRIEGRAPIPKPLDVLAQHLVTMALGRGFDEEELKAEVRTAHSYQDLTDAEWWWCLEFVQHGGPTLRAYPEYRKIIERKGRWIVEDKRIAQRHRMSVGTIVSEASVEIRYVNGASLGTVEEGFVSKLKRGDRFLFAGRVLEFVRLKNMVCQVKRATKKAGLVPRWAGGRLPLSSELAQTAREELGLVREGEVDGPELELALPLLNLQGDWSALPAPGELLIERVKTRDGWSHFVYPIEGRLVHEGLAALTAHRLSRRVKATFSLACNDYGFELLCPDELAISPEEWRDLLSPDNLVEDILASLNSSEMARRQFREIARIAGLIFQGYPGAPRTARQLQTSSGLLFDVFEKYDPENPLLEQANREVLDRNLERSRLRDCLLRLQDSELLCTEPPKPTPMSFPLLVDRLRDTVASEASSDRILKIVAQLEKAANG